MNDISKMLVFLFFSLCVGAALGCFYDMFRVFRMLLYGRAIPSKDMKRLLPASEKDVEELLSTKQLQGFPSAAFFLTFFCDIIFWLISAVCVAVLVFQFGSGRVRFFALLGCGAGFLFYRATVGRTVIFLAGKVIFVLKKIVVFFRED